MSRRAMRIRWQQVYDDMRLEFEAMGTGSLYNQMQKEYAFRLMGEHGIRATARILELPRRTLQRWCREQSRYVKPCPDWVCSWAARRQKRQRF